MKHSYYNYRYNTYNNINNFGIMNMDDNLPLYTEENESSLKSLKISRRGAKGSQCLTINY